MFTLQHRLTALILEIKTSKCICSLNIYNFYFLACLAKLLLLALYVAVDLFEVCILLLIPVAAPYKAWVRGRSVVGIACYNPAVDIRCTSLVIGVCCQVQVSAKVRTLGQRIPTECGVS